MTKKRFSATKSNDSDNLESKTESTSNDEPQEQAPNTPARTQNSFLTFLACSLALSLSWNTAKQQLTPLYGSVPTEFYFIETLTAFLIISAFVPSIPKQYALPVLSAAFIMAPMVLQKVGVEAVKLRNPVIGPIIGYAASLGPITILLQGIIKNVLFPKPTNTTDSDNSEQRYKLTKRVVITLLPSVIVSQTQQQCRMTYSILSKLSLTPSYIYIVLGVAFCVTHVLNSPRLQSKNSFYSQSGSFLTDWPVVLTILLLPISLFQNPLLPLKTPYTDPSGTLTILSSSQSLTGRILVGENHQHGFRYLRADHSLLGGVWIGDKVIKMGKDGVMVKGDDVHAHEEVFRKDVNGSLLGDSIYSTFVLQEAVRLFERDGEPKNALVIGLGIGISAQSFISHNLSTTIIEIDPAVYTASRQYFGLENPSQVYLQDARSWVERRAKAVRSTSDSDITVLMAKRQMEKEKFDIIVHDCFSGGGVPEHLFTIEFWDNVKAILSVDGIIAVNFAGHVHSHSSKAILLTLQRAFGQCRVFHDHPLDSDVDYTKLFINLVFFCTPSPNPLNFRTATKEDYLDSYLREYVLGVFEKREVPLHIILGPQQDVESDTAEGDDRLKQKEVEMEKWILRDKHNPLDAWQKAGAMEHWHVMRSVLPDVFWETY